MPRSLPRTCGLGWTAARSPWAMVWAEEGRGRGSRPSSIARCLGVGPPRALHTHGERPREYLLLVVTLPVVTTSFRDNPGGVRFPHNDTVHGRCIGLQLTSHHDQSIRRLRTHASRSKRWRGSACWRREPFTVSRVRSGRPRFTPDTMHVRQCVHAGSDPVQFHSVHAEIGLRSPQRLNKIDET